MKNMDIVLGSVAGAATFLVALIFFEAPIFLAVVFGAAAFGLGSLVSTQRPAEIAQQDARADAVKDGKAKLGTMLRLQSQLEDGIPKKKLGDLCVVTKKILAELERDPEDLQRAKQFLNYYLPTTITIIEKYQKLTASGAREDTIRDSMKKINETLFSLHAAFEKQLAMLLSNDMMDLDTELQLLKANIGNL